MKLAARILCVILLLAASSWLLAQPAAAQTQPTQPQSSPLSLDANPDVPQNLRTFTQGVVLESMAALSCILSGVDPTRPDQRCLGTDPVTGKLGFVQNGGAIGFMGNMIGILYTPPIHTGEYFQSLAQNFGIAKPAYAQNPQNGMSFSQLGPLSTIWRQFLRLVYMVFVVIFILLGMGIMLRFKIDPRTVMTIENQLPRIIITIILVTFSFAIAAFLIDIMFYATYVIINFLAAIPNSHINVQEVNKTLYSPPMGFLNSLTKNDNSLGGVLDLTWNAAVSITFVVKNLFVGGSWNDIIRNVDPRNAQCGSIINLGCWAEAIVGGTIATIVGGILGFLITTIIGILGYLIILLALLIAMFKLWFQLIRAYVYILLDIILAPLWIMLGAFPGSTVSIGSWLRDIIANLSAFPVAIGMFLLGNIFMHTLGTRDSGSLFVPPLIGNPNLVARPPGITDINPQGILGSLAAMGIILMTPKVVDMMREVLKAPNFKYTAAIGEALGASQGYVGGVIKKPWEALTKVDAYGGAQGALAVWFQKRQSRLMRGIAEYGMGAKHRYEYNPETGVQETVRSGHRPSWERNAEAATGTASQGDRGQQTQSQQPR